MVASNHFGYVFLGREIFGVNISQSLVIVFEFAPCKLDPMPAFVCVLEY